MSRRSRLAASLALAVALLAGAAVAQQPQPPPQPDVPPGHPPILPLEKTKPGAFQPPQRQPGVPPGRPIGPGGQQFPPGRGPGPGGPGRMIPVPGPGGRAPAAAPAPAPKPEFCPGHGPMDAPHHINWWRGLIGVNNEAAEKGGLSSLLWRYHNNVDPCDTKNQPPPFLASLINFSALLFILYRFGKKPLAEGLKKRRQTIMQEIENAAQLKKAAEQRMKEIQAKLKRLSETREELKADYAAQAEAERKNMLAEMEERRARMRRDAEFRIEQELKEARSVLLQEAVRGAASAAEQLVRQHVSAADQQRLADEYLSAFPVAIGSTSSSLGARPASQSTGAST